MQLNTFPTTGAVVLAIMAATVAGCHGTGTAAPGRYDQPALQTLDAVVRGDFDVATAHFDTAMGQRLPPAELGAAWTAFQQEFGTYQSHGVPDDVALGELTVVNVPLQMQEMPGQFRITFHPDSTVAGLYFLKTGVPIS